MLGGVRWLAARSVGGASGAAPWKVHQVGHTVQRRVRRASPLTSLRTPRPSPTRPPRRATAPRPATVAARRQPQWRLERKCGRGVQGCTGGQPISPAVASASSGLPPAAPNVAAPDQMAAVSTLADAHVLGSSSLLSPSSGQMPCAPGAATAVDVAHVDVTLPTRATRERSAPAASISAFGGGFFNGCVAGAST